MDINEIEVPHVMGLPFITGGKPLHASKVIERVGIPGKRINNDLRYRLSCHGI